MYVVCVLLVTNALQMGGLDHLMPHLYMFFCIKGMVCLHVFFVERVWCVLLVTNAL